MIARGPAGTIVSTAVEHNASRMPRYLLCGCCVLNFLGKISVVLTEPHMSCIDGNELSNSPFRGQC